MNAANRKQNNHHSSRSLRRGFRRGVADQVDPWLVLNMANFTFEGQPLNGFNRLASHQVYGFSSAFTQPGAKNARTFAIFAVRLGTWSRKID